MCSIENLSVHGVRCACVRAYVHTYRISFPRFNITFQIVSVIFQIVHVATVILEQQRASSRVKRAAISLGCRQATLKREREKARARRAAEGASPLMYAWTNTLLTLALQYVAFT